MAQSGEAVCPISQIERMEKDATKKSVLESRREESFKMKEDTPPAADYLAVIDSPLAKNADLYEHLPYHFGSQSDSDDDGASFQSATG